MNNLEISVLRHLNLTSIIDYIVNHGMTLHRFELKGDWIDIQVSAEDKFDIALFEEEIADLEYRFDLAQGLIDEQEIEQPNLTNKSFAYTMATSLLNSRK